MKTTINHETYVSLEIAKLLKEAGFDWKQYSFYNSKGIFMSGTFAANWNDTIYYIDGNKISAPTLAIAQRWLREEKLYNVLIDTNGYKNYEYFIDYHGVKKGSNYPFHEYNHNLIYNTYEEALEAGIKKTIEMILNK